MKNEYLPYLRVLVGSHKYYEGSMGAELAEHQKTLTGLNVEDALESINKYAETYQEICCLYACVAFIKRFPKANARLAYSPEENPLYPHPNRASAKVALVLDGKVCDLVSMIGHKDEMTFERLLTTYCNIDIKDYCRMSLEPGEVFTVLPPVKGHEKEHFLVYFFQNDDAEEYAL